MSGIFKNDQNFFLVEKKWLKILKEQVEKSPKKMSRLLLHLNAEDKVQEMLIAFNKKTLISPNKSLNKSESLLIIEGKVLLILFDNDGKIKNKIIMQNDGDDQSVFMYRINKGEWHTMKALSKEVIVYEILEGPFTNSSEEKPKWMPKDQKELKNFIDKIN
tara:strand:+ start:210 stop:692 length:483 start_codon:yes stop_codon:yes gene_type:complete